MVKPPIKKEWRNNVTYIIEKYSYNCYASEIVDYGPSIWFKR